ncbi:MAG: glycoside hydrolase family 27 protein [Ignavibacteriaceae bacterium]|jgi:alpha-galactosidase
MNRIGLLLLLVISINCYAQKFDSLALTPPMGWNTYNTFAGNYNEQILRDMADKLVSSGMKDAGYIYIIIDDNWTATRDSLGFLTVDKGRFPSGMQAVSDYIHSKGLKLGLYSDVGYKTCGGFIASRGHEFQDALMCARWGCDYLKYDWCNSDGINAIGAYTTMRDAIFAAKRPMVFSMCEWGNNKPWEWAASVGHLWRTTGDITACFDCIDTHGGKYNSLGVMQILDLQEGLRKFAGPGHWNDPDMLEVGNGTLTLTESRAHFSLWAMIAAPLISGNDLRNMSKDVLDILTNKEVIAIDQDSLGIEGFKQSKADSLEIWFKPLKNGDWALCFFNRGSKTVNINYDWKNKVVNDDVAKLELQFKNHTYTLRDLWAKQNIGNTATTLKSRLVSHDVLMLRLIK